MMFDETDDKLQEWAAIREEQHFREAISFLVKREHQVDMDGVITIFKETAGTDSRYCVSNIDGEEIYTDLQQAILCYLQFCRTYTGK
jgi:diaminopimelate epimerase